MNSPLLSLENVRRNFSGKTVLHPIHLAIQSGESVAITGPNGSGKTTLLRIMSTLLSPSSGKVTLFDPEEDDLFEKRKKIGALFVESLLYSDLSVRENLSFYAMLYQIPAREKVISHWLERMNMRRLEHESVRTLSRGERQRVALIRSLIHDPLLLLWDEPTTGLDESGRQLLTEIVREKKGKVSLILATHDLPTVQGWTDRTIALKNGKIV